MSKVRIKYWVEFHKEEEGWTWDEIYSEESAKHIEGFPHGVHHEGEQIVKWELIEASDKMVAIIEKDDWTDEDTEAIWQWLYFEESVRVWFDQGEDRWIKTWRDENGKLEGVNFMQGFESCNDVLFRKPDDELTRFYNAIATTTPSDRPPSINSAIWAYLAFHDPELIQD